MAAAAALEYDLNRLLIALFLVGLPFASFAERHIVIVQGLGGDAQYSDLFSAQVDTIEAASRSVTAGDQVHTLRGQAASREAILGLLDDLAMRTPAIEQLTLFLIGHGSYDDHDYKFNLPGPDLSGTEIASALDKQPTDNLILVNTSSASGALSELVTRDRRVIALATRSGRERHATRFGTHFAQALTDDAADVDKNKTISVAEAFRYAERRVADYFERNGQLATEHPVLHGDRAERFTLARLQKPAPRPAQGQLAALLEQREALNAEIETLRLERDTLDAQEYQGLMLPKLLELARLEDAIEAEQESDGE